jgi:hypothetical protein
MSKETTIHCPSCRHEFELSAVMRAELEAEVRATMAKQFGEALEEELRDLRKKLSDANSKEAEILKKQRELDSRERELGLEMERRLVEQVALVREQEAKLAEKRTALREEQQRLRDEEHRQQIVGLEKTITELTRKVQQGSQQVQGEAQEVVLRDVLTAAFAIDSVTDVPKGQNGADVVHGVRTSDGREVGRIVWESKRTRNWSDGWLAKVRDDQREAGADCAVIVTQALPHGIRDFGQKEGVWVCAPAFAVPLGIVLRSALTQVAAARRAAEGSGQKMQLLYGYIQGSEFRNRLGGVIESFNDMQDELESERRATQTRWKRKEKIIERARDNIAALAGELQGIVGRDLNGLLPPSFEPVALLSERAESAITQ